MVGRLPSLCLTGAQSCTHLGRKRRAFPSSSDFNSPSRFGATCQPFLSLTLPSPVPIHTLSPGRPLRRFLLYSFASNALLNARWDQWPGMILTGAVGYFISTAASAVFSANVLASIAIGLTGSIYSRFSGHLPVTMVSGEPTRVLK